MSAADNKAVFLSYASQDAAAAQRICEALRAVGVEVWFDQNELVGGDAWDQKIRKQIGSCALFVPIISANTEARAEGYFRLEWRLADKRTELMGKTKTFLLPVCIDDTRDANADVPDSFLTVQWTRLRDGEATPAFCERVRKLLNPEAGAQRHEVKAAGSAAAPVAPARRGQGWRRPVAALLAIMVLGVALYFALRREPEPKTGARAVSSQPPAQSETGPRAEARKLIAQAWEQLNRAGVYRAELEIAGDLCQRAAELDSANPDVWAAWSQVDSWFVYHTLDNSSARRESARTKAERALRLDARSYEARLAQACYVVRGTISPGVEDALGVVPATEQTLRVLVQERGADPRPLFALGILLRNTRRWAEAAATFDLMAKLPGCAADAFKEKAWVLIYAGDMRQAQEATERSIAAGEFFGNLQLRSYIAVNWTGDLAAARDAVSRVPSSMQLEPMFLFLNIKVFYFCRDPQAMLQMLNAVPQAWLATTAFSGPRHYLMGIAHTMAGKAEAAQLAWQEALRVVEAKLATDTGSADLHAWKACLLGLLGRRAEAESTARLAESISRGFGLEALIALGRNDQALLYLESRETRLAGFQAWWAWLKNYPLLDPLRSEPRFQALLARAEADPRRNPHVPLQAESSTAVPPAAGAAKADPSVAVLAFANLSDDKANEYFSDGISEELLNVLAKIPGLKVSARTSAFSFKGKNVPIPEIAKQLGVAYVVEGSVRKAGSQVRIKAQLIKAVDGFHVWSDTFTRELKDVFAVQDEIAGLIAKNLSLQLGTSSAAAVAGAVNPEAYRLYLEGRAAWNRRDAAGFQQAEQLFNHALELEPRFARAHAALADVWTVRAAPLSGSYGQRQSPLQIRIIAKAEHAVALDENSAEAHASLGHALGQAWRFAEALRALRRAIKLNPNYASAHQWLGRLLHTQGQLEEGLAALRRAAELDPLSHRILDNYSDALANAGRLEEAWAVLGRAIALHPSGVQIRCKQAQLLARLGRRAEALAAARALAADAGAEEPDYRYSTAVGVFSALGEAAEAEALLRRIAPGSEDLPVALAFAGRTGELFQQLDNMTINWVENIWFDPMLAPVRTEPAFREWTKRVGLAEALARAEAWRAANPVGKATR